MDVDSTIETRTAIHAALAEPHRLRIVDELSVSDRSPAELSAVLGLGSNLLAHHVDVLERVGIVERLTSAGDARRRYVHLRAAAVVSISRPAETLFARRVLFVCNANSARSQLAAAVWNARHDVPASSAGTEPADNVAAGAIETARRAGLDLTGARPRSLASVSEKPDLVVTVCDVAREDLPPDLGNVRTLHWSIPDPVLEGTPEAFDEALRRIDARVGSLAEVVELPTRRRSSA